MTMLKDLSRLVTLDVEGFYLVTNITEDFNPILRFYCILREMFL